MKKNILVSTLLLALSLVFVGCQSERELSKEEIGEVNEAFKQLLPVEKKEDADSSGPDGNFKTNPICHFFSSYYDDVKDLDMGKFVYYITRESYLKKEDKEELDSLKDLELEIPFNIIEEGIIPFGRIPYAKVEKYLKTYANISLKDMTNMSGAIYSDKYKNFYSYASDFGLGEFTCTGGKIIGDKVILFSEHAELTLKKLGDKYFIVSHLQNKKD